MNGPLDRSIIGDNEPERLSALEKYKILNTPPEKAFSHIANMVAKSFNVPIALISFVSEEEVFFKANFGYEEQDRADRGISLCALAILQDETTVFENPLEEPCLLSNPIVHGDFGLRFYAGAPLKTSDGHNIGTVCIIDHKQRFFSKDQIKLLEDFSEVIMDLLNLRKIALSK